MLAEGDAPDRFDSVLEKHWSFMGTKRRAWNRKMPGEQHKRKNMKRMERDDLEDRHELPWSNMNKRKRHERMDEEDQAASAYHRDTYEWETHPLYRGEGTHEEKDVNP